MFITATGATPITIELPVATSVAAWAMVVLLGVIAYFLRREIKNNDAAHAALAMKIDTVAQSLEKKIDTVAQAVAAIARDVSFLAGRQAERDRTTGRRA